MKIFLWNLRDFVPAFSLKKFFKHTNIDQCTCVEHKRYGKWKLNHFCMIHNNQLGLFLCSSHKHVWASARTNEIYSCRTSKSSWASVFTILSLCLCINQCFYVNKSQNLICSSSGSSEDLDYFDNVFMNFLMHRRFVWTHLKISSFVLWRWGI